MTQTKASRREVLRWLAGAPVAGALGAATLPAIVRAAPASAARYRDAGPNSAGLKSTVLEMVSA